MLTQNRVLVCSSDPGLSTYQMTPNAHIFKGAFVGVDPDGLARPLVAGDRFVGIAVEETEPGDPGPTLCRVRTEGIFVLPLCSVEKIGSGMFALDDETAVPCKADWIAADSSFLGWIVNVWAENKTVLLRLETSIPWASVASMFYEHTGRLDELERRVNAMTAKIAE